MTTHTADAGTATMRRRAAFGASVGTLIEYYDYYLYGLAAATVFPKVFFPSGDATTAQLAFCYIRDRLPASSHRRCAVFGHVGDRMGRKTALMITVVGMGLATTAMGLIPSADSIGMAAPLLLIFCRMFRGLFVGGEMGGAATLIVEHAPPGRRGFYGSLLIVGAGLANVMTAGLMAVLARNEAWFLDWGWRLPFVFSIVLVVIAVAMRSKLEESDEFQKLSKEQEQHAGPRKLPLFQALRTRRTSFSASLWASCTASPAMLC